MEEIRQTAKNQLKPVTPYMDKILCISGRVIAAILCFCAMGCCLIHYFSTGFFLYLLASTTGLIEYSPLLEKRVSEGQENFFKRTVKVSDKTCISVQIRKYRFNRHVELFLNRKKHYILDGIYEP